MLERYVSNEKRFIFDVEDYIGDLNGTKMKHIKIFAGAMQVDLWLTANDVETLREVLNSGDGTN